MAIRILSLPDQLSLSDLKLQVEFVDLTIRVHSDLVTHHLPLLQRILTVLLSPFLSLNCHTSLLVVEPCHLCHF